MSQTQGTLHFFDLPIELHRLVVDLLQFPDTAHFRATCSYFASLVPPQASTYLELVAANDSAWALKRRRVACVFCARMRPASAFTEKEKSARADWRSCHECTLLEFEGAGSRMFPTMRVPINYRRTRFTDDPRELVVDRKETGICYLCHNSFKRWGRSTAERGLCIGCFNQHPTEESIQQEIRLDQDLVRMGRDCILNWAGCYASELVEAVAGEDWMDCYEWDYPPAMVPVWRGGKRGVTVRTREEASQLYFEIQLAEWSSREEIAAVVQGQWN